MQCNWKLRNRYVYIGSLLTVKSLMGVYSILIYSKCRYQEHGMGHYVLRLKTTNMWSGLTG
jgi:hypothetical protein